VVIAIDGPGGVGKSTVTRLLSQVLGIDFLDTGATYRAAAVAALEAGADLDDESSVLDAVTGRVIAYDSGVITLDGVPINEEVRSERVTRAVTPVSAFPRVREHVVQMQRDWVRDHGGNAVVEGRDIGTVVFPDAAVKVFLTAPAALRAARRSGDAEAADKAVAEIIADLNRRDQADSTREASPLRPAEDAIEIDTSTMTAEEVAAAILDLVRAVEGADWEMG
jgi:CMP/dCMP kinase